MLRSLRGLLLELWAVLVLGAVMGFLGPFGTYNLEPIASRIGHWSLLLAEAYLVVRPGIAGFAALSQPTGLPREAMQFWGAWVCSAPLAVVWRVIGNNQAKLLANVAVLMPTSLLCSIAILGIARWADATGARRFARATGAQGTVLDAELGEGLAPESMTSEVTQVGPDALLSTLSGRLSPGVEGPILALQSEDHYVRVHTAKSNELLLMRLRDAIAEMGGTTGEQVHRSWWVAKAGIARVVIRDRKRTIELTNGIKVPIARDSLERLQRNGFLPP